MPTHDYIIANDTGFNVRVDIQNAFQASASLNSSGTQPAVMYAYQLWADTSTNLLKIRNGGNSAWITLRQLDGDFSIVAVEDGLVGTPSITFTNDLNTGIFRPGNDQLAIVTAGTRRLLIDSTGALTIDTGDAEIYGVRVGRGGGAVSSNTAAGSLALNANTIGAFNTAVGKNALTLNVGGTDNTAMGSSALGGNTSGIGNTAIGLQSLFTNSTANYNTAVGLGALFTNNAANNTAVGVGALKFNSSGTTNTALGTIALENNTLGSNNICLGYNSGSSLTTGSNNTIIGQIPGTAALADTLILGIGVTERLRITSTNTLNFVGAGTAGSTQTVSLSGSAPINSLVMDSGGRFGIGTANFGGKLTVQTSTSNGAPAAWDSGQLVVTTGTGTASLGIALSVDSTNNSASITSLTPLITWNPIHYRASSHIFYKADATTNEVARIDSSGRLLVGTSTARDKIYNGTTVSNIPQFQSEVSGNGVINRAMITGNCGTGVSDIGPALILARSTGTTVNSYTAVTSVANHLGSVSFQGADGTEFVEGARIEALVDGTPGANVMPGRLVFSTTPDGSASPTERMRIPSSGGLLLNTTSRINDGLATIGFQGSIQKGLILNDTDPANTRQFIGFHISGTTQIGYIANNNNTGVTYNTSSDYRLKENVVPLTGALDRLNQLQVHRFNFIAAPDHTVDGFLAHEAQAVVPECVTGEKDAVDEDGNPVYQGIDQSKLVPLLTAALQEAIAKIETLEARLTAAGIA